MSARELAALVTGFGCFGFFASRFDRFCPFAIADSCLKACAAYEPDLTCAD